MTLPAPDIARLQSAIDTHRRKAERLGIQYNTLQRRFKTGWSVERALTEPVRSWHHA